MRIAFIGQKGIPVVYGGVERRVQEISTRMASMGHEVFVFARKGYNNKDIKKYKKVKIIYLPTIKAKHFETIIHTFLSTLYVLFNNFEVVHYQAPGPSSLSWMVKLFRPDIALIATFNSRDSKHQKWGRLARAYLNFGEWVINKVPDKTIVVGEVLRSYVEKRFNEKPVIVRNGSAILKTSEFKKSKILNKWKLKKDKYFILVNRLIRHKGIDYAMKAFDNAHKKKRIPEDFKLVVVGDSSYTDDYLNYLKDLSKINKNIILVGNQIGKNLAMLYYSSFNFIQPSEAEGLSNSLLEAMGYGKAPIFSDIPENLAPVQGNGFIFENKNIKDLEDKMVFSIDNKKITKEIGKKAKKHVEENYSWDFNVEKTLSLYKKIMLQKKSNYASIIKKTLLRTNIF